MLAFQETYLQYSGTIDRAHWILRIAMDDLVLVQDGHSDIGLSQFKILTESWNLKINYKIARNVYNVVRISQLGENIIKNIIVMLGETEMKFKLDYLEGKFWIY